MHVAYKSCVYSTLLFGLSVIMPATSANAFEVPSNAEMICSDTKNTTTFLHGETSKRELEKLYQVSATSVFLCPIYGCWVEKKFNDEIELTFTEQPPSDVAIRVNGVEKTTISLNVSMSVLIGKDNRSFTTNSFELSYDLKNRIVWAKEVERECIQISGDPINLTSTFKHD